MSSLIGQKLRLAFEPQGKPWCEKLWYRSFNQDFSLFNISVTSKTVTSTFLPKLLLPKIFMSLKNWAAQISGNPKIDIFGPQMFTVALSKF